MAIKPNVSAIAGQRGGLATLRRYGISYFSELGKKGQKTLRQRYPGMARDWGRMGGRPRKPSLEEVEGDGEK